MARTFALLASLVIIGLIGFGMIRVAVQDGVGGLVIVSFVVLLILTVGVIGALTEPSDDE